MVWAKAGDHANMAKGCSVQSQCRGHKVTLPRDPMHLKSYQIDGKLLRTGAVNFSASGLKRQDTEAAASFKRNFDAQFASGEVLSAGAR
jgi:hypothetical protein